MPLAVHAQPASQPLVADEIPDRQIDSTAQGTRILERLIRGQNVTGDRDFRWSVLPGQRVNRHLVGNPFHLTGDRRNRPWQCGVGDFAIADIHNGTQIRPGDCAGPIDAERDINRRFNAQDRVLRPDPLGGNPMRDSSGAPFLNDRTDFHGSVADRHRLSGDGIDRCIPNNVADRERRAIRRVAFFAHLRPQPVGHPIHFTSNFRFERRRQVE